jgi:uncharacterized metal-binding protein
MGIKKTLKNVFTRYNGTNINNITVNYMFAPIFALILYKFLTKYIGVPNSDPRYPLGGAYYLTLYSTLFYCYCSTFFQPDLDQDQHRPGKHSFPFGSSVLGFGPGRFLRALSWPINRFWYFLWHPFGMLFTHRGMGHWPVLGVWVRVLYLYAWYIFFEGVAMRMGFYNVKFRLFEYWLKAFFPWNEGFGTVGFYVFCLPVFMADLFHSAVDLYESNKKGTAFCAKTQKRGILAKIYLEFKNIPKTMSSHFRDFLD